MVCRVRFCCFVVLSGGCVRVYRRVVNFRKVSVAGGRVALRF